MDAETGQRRRHHLHESVVQREVRAAARRAGLAKPATCHALRHSFATHLLEAGYDILVSYASGELCVSHEGLVRAVDEAGSTQYPGFSDDPLDGFRHIRADLERYGEAFLESPDDELDELLLTALRLEAERPRGIAGLP